jgi:hypothetical protein
MSTQALSFANSLNFDQMIAAPFTAAAKSQGVLSATTIDFLNAFALDISGNVRTATLSTYYDDPSGSFVTTTDGVTTRQSVKSLTIPIIALVNVPAFQLQKMTINLDVTINSITKSATQVTASLELGVKSGGGIFKALGGPEVNLKVSGATKYDTSNELSTQVVYKLEVIAENKQPRGIDMLLDWVTSSQNPVERNRAAAYTPGPITM